MENLVTNISRLYCLQPIGLGTEMIECLTSYIVRLAAAHCVYTGTLIKEELAPAIQKHYLINYSSKGGNGFYDWAHALNGSNKNAHDFTEVLKQLTLCENLQYTTMITWRNVLPSKGLQKTNMEWCPCCFEEWKANNQPIYIPLLWTIKSVTTCVKHKIKLVDICPVCNKKIPFLHRKSILGFCPKCDCWLGLGHDTLINNLTPSNNWDNWVNSSVGNILSQAPKLSSIPERSVIQELIDDLVYQTTNNITSFGRLLNIPKLTIYYWIGGRSIPTLAYLLYIGRQFSIPLIDMLTKANIKIQNDETGSINSMNKTKGEREEKDFTEVCIKLLQQLSLETPISMNKASLNVGVNKRTLYRKFPELCKEISKRYKEHSEKLSDEKRDYVYNLVRNTVEEIASEGIYPSRRQVEARLPKNIILKDFTAKEAWKSYR
jgi:hypothetical protein